MLTYQEYKKTVQLYKFLGLDYSLDQIQCDINTGYLTINRGRDGLDYMWYYDGWTEGCISVATGNYLSKKEVDKQFL